MEELGVKLGQKAFLEKEKILVMSVFSCFHDVYLDNFFLRCY